MAGIEDVAATTDAEGIREPTTVITGLLLESVIEGTGDEVATAVLLAVRVVEWVNRITPGLS